MKMIYTILFLFSMMGHNAVPVSVELRIVDYFGEYRCDDSLTVALDLETMSLAQVSERLKKIKRSVGKKPNPGALVIGYGNSPEISKFIIKTAVLESDKKVPELLGERMPEPKPKAQWYFYYIEKPYDKYLYENKRHHWSSPYNVLIDLGNNAYNIDN